MKYEVKGTELQVGNFTYRIESFDGECFAVRTDALHGEILKTDHDQYDGHHYIYDDDGVSAIWKNESELLNAINQGKFRFGVCIAHKVLILDYRVKFYDENENEIKV